MLISPSLNGNTTENFMRSFSHLPGGTDSDETLYINRSSRTWMTDRGLKQIMVNPIIGAENTPDLRRLMYTGVGESGTFILLFSLTDRLEFFKTQYYAQEIKTSRPHNLIILVGTELERGHARVITREEGERKCREIEAYRYMECSTVDGIGVQEIITAAARVTPADVAAAAVADHTGPTHSI